MKRDITYCINQKCKLNCLRKNIPKDKPLVMYSLANFNYENCEFYLKEENSESKIN
ncbi:hypothetical protein [Clostridium sp.]|uniref:hypothetical protein n=1 Tax=Clostridium sp. TaxID=1506 RepID=UPI0032172A9F